jgi:hypothetical protein
VQHFKVPGELSAVNLNGEVFLRLQTEMPGYFLDKFPDLDALMADLLGLAVTVIDRPEIPIARLIIVDQDCLGDRLRTLEEELHLDGCETDTDDDFYQAVGKTMPFESDAGDVTNVVVLTSGIVFSVLRELENGKKSDDWDRYAKLGFDTICHEFGHCVDNLVRNDLTTSNPEFEVFKIKTIADYYISHLTSELGAIFWSASAVFFETYERYESELHDTIRKSLDRITYLKDTLDFSPPNLRLTASEVSQLFWLIIVKYSELKFMSLHNSSLPAPRHDTFDERMIPILVCTDHELQTLAGKYPEWTVDSFCGLVNCWSAICRKYGYEFVEDNGEDRLLWV